MHVLPAPVVSGLRVAGPAFFLSMQASSVQTALRIQAEKTVGDLSPIPFISMFTNCVIWTYYGFLRQDMTVLVPNLIGIFAGLIGMYSYQKFCGIPGKLLAVTSLIVGTSTILAFQGNWNLLGLIGCACAVILSGSPLATVQKVFQSKSTASLPFMTSLTTWLNALSWLSYGILVANDPMIYGPNSLGFGLASFQLLLFVIFGFPTSDLSSKQVTGKSLF